MAELYVQYGAGRQDAPGWLNFDASPTVRLERLPLVGRLIKVNAERFPDGIRFGDIVAGLPVADNSVTGAYASHILEHLAYDDFWTALRNTHRMLRPGGVFRLIVPDLQERARRYLAGVAANDPEAASRFLENSCLGHRSRPRSLRGRMRAMLGNADHLWMWDEVSIAAALREAGFTEIRRCRFGDAADAAFAAVEQEDRFTDTNLDIAEIAMEAKKPAA